MKTFKQWLQTKDGKRFKEIMNKNVTIEIAMRAAWDASADNLQNAIDEEYFSHQDWCQTHYSCNCGVEK